jgi:ArsR family transcriptional regulator
MNSPNFVNQLNDDGQLKEMVNYFKLFADESRLRILYFLSRQNEVNVRTLCETLTQTQPAVSHHLGLLKAAGVVEMRRDGKHNYYRVASAKLSQIEAAVARLFSEV